MKFKSNTGITWSLLELTGILEDDDSHVTFERIKKHFGLHPFHLTNLQSALNEILSSNLNSYDAELNGFIIAYKNPVLLTPLGEIVYDTCFVHVDIEADFYVFRPKVGCPLKGIVNKRGLNHIGVLVHKAFNVSIPRPEKEEDWPGDNVDIGQEIKFTVTQLDFNGRLPFIRGSLDRENYLQNCKLNTTGDDLCNGDTHVEETGGERVHHVKANSLADSDSETTQEEVVTKKVDRVSLKKNSKKYRYTNDDFEEPELKKKKKHSKKSDRNDIEQSVEYDTPTTSSQTETNDTEEDSASRYNRSEFNNTIPLLNETDSGKSKKHSKRNKSSKRFSDAENEITIKTEKSPSFGGSLDNIVEASTIKKKTKRKDTAQSKQLNNENHEEVNDNEVLEKQKRNSVKRHTKKSKESDFNSDSDNTFMQPEIQMTHNNVSNEGVNEEINTNVKSKRKSKKFKESDSDFDVNNVSIKPEIQITYNSISNEEASEEISENLKPKRKSKKSKQSDSNFDANNVSIKPEILVTHDSVSNEEANEEISTNVKSKRKSKKSKESDSDIDLNNISIKPEIQITYNSISNEEASEEISENVKPKRKSKKSKQSDSDFDANNVSIKPEIQVSQHSVSNEEANEEISTNVKSKKKFNKSKESNSDFDPNNMSIKPEIQMSYSSILEEEINANIKSKKKSKKIKESEYEIEHRPIPIKSEINEEVMSTISPKKKSRKHNNEAKNPESPKKRSKRFDTPESEPGFESIKIKTEKDTDKLDSLEERQREHETMKSNHDETERTSLSHCSTERESRSVEKSPKSKSKTSTRRIHIEYEDSTMIIKSENLDDDTFKETIETNSANVNYSVDRVQVKTENSMSDSSIDESSQEKIRTKARLSLRRKTGEKGSPKKKHSRKSRTSDAELDFHNVMIKVEEPTDERLGEGVNM